MVVVELVPLSPVSAAVLALGFWAWALLRLLLQVTVRRSPDWSPGLDGFGTGVVVSAAVVLAAGVVRV